LDILITDLYATTVFIVQAAPLTPGTEGAGLAGIL